MKRRQTTLMTLFSVEFASFFYSLEAFMVHVCFYIQKRYDLILYRAYCMESPLTRVICAFKLQIIQSGYYGHTYRSVRKWAPPATPATNLEIRKL